MMQALILLIHIFLLSPLLAAENEIMIPQPSMLRVMSFCNLKDVTAIGLLSKDLHSNFFQHGFPCTSIGEGAFICFILAISPIRKNHQECFEWFKDFLSANTGNTTIHTRYQDICGERSDWEKNSKQLCSCPLSMALFMSTCETIDVHDSRGDTPLIYAAKINNISIMKWLLMRDAEVNKVNRCLDVALTWSVFYNNISAVRLLLAKGALVNVKNIFGNSPLLIACGQYGAFELVKLLIEHNANVNDKDRFGCTPLIKAVQNLHKDMIELLLAKGCNVNATDMYGNTAFMYAAQAGREPILELLFAKKALPDLKNNAGDNPLMLALKRNKIDAVFFLIEKGCDLTARDRWGNSPLMVATRKEHMTLIRFLREQIAYNRLMADHSLQDAPKPFDKTSLSSSQKAVMLEKKKELKKKKKAFLLARKSELLQDCLATSLKSKKQDFFYKLLTQDADINGLDSMGETVLMWSIGNQDMKAIGFLLKRDDLDLEVVHPDTGETALIKAARMNFIGGVKSLTNKGANVQAKDKEGKTVLTWALCHKSKPITMLIEEQIRNKKTDGPDVE